MPLPAGSGLRAHVADEDVAPAGARNTTPVSLFDLPLGEYPQWTITEEHAPERGEHVGALLLAWHAGSRHQLLTAPSLAFGAAVQALRQLAELTGPVEAVQSAVARYSRRGFEAAAVTALGIRMTARVHGPPEPHRTAPSGSRTRTPDPDCAASRGVSTGSDRRSPTLGRWIIRWHRHSGTW